MTRSLSSAIMTRPRSAVKVGCAAVKTMRRAPIVCRVSAACWAGPAEPVDHQSGHALAADRTALGQASVAPEAGLAAFRMVLCAYLKIGTGCGITQYKSWDNEG